MGYSDYTDCLRAKYEGFCATVKEVYEIFTDFYDDRADLHIKPVEQIISRDIRSLEGMYSKSYRDWETDRKSTRLNSSHSAKSRMPSSA